MENNYKHAIAPKRVIRGEGAWEKSKFTISNICKRPLFIGRSKSTASIRNFLKEDLLNDGIHTLEAEIRFDCCEEDLSYLKNIYLERKFDAVITAGGGKVLDTGKLIAHRLELPCITIPLSASTCAGWTALSNIYSPEGAFQKDEALDKCPDLLIFDHKLIRQAPNRTLASGIADALAKWYESSISSGSNPDGLVQQAVQMARVLRDQLLLDGEIALKDNQTLQWIRVAEGCALTAGLIGGIGGAHCRTAAAHAIHNGLTQIKSCNSFLHGEKVGYGILAQLRLEEIVSNNHLAGQARKQVLDFLKKINIPVKINDLVLDPMQSIELSQACNFICRKGSDIYNLPFKIEPKQVHKAIIEAGAESSSPKFINQTN